MNLGSVIAVIGIVLSALGGFWYWRVFQVAVGFGGRTNLDRTLNQAIAVVCMGLVVFLIGVAVTFVTKDGDT